MCAGLFNSSSETSARLLMALPIIDRPASLDEITAIDLVATYMQFFGYGDRNIHGDNEFALAEYDARRARVEAGLKRLVRSGYALSKQTGNIVHCRRVGDRSANSARWEFC
ncbi:hypothetical protein CIP107532_01829 [Corynebacterium diphtheriae]|nr:hypothetical protein CIP107532_01829 [Corynebacterium diphtheriae]